MSTTTALLQHYNTIIEELAEAANAASRLHEARYNPAINPPERKTARGELSAEVTQVAAVAVRWAIAITAQADR